MSGEEYSTAAGTTVADVRVEIDTTLDDPDIEAILDRIERDVDREDSPPEGDDRVDLEAVLAALWIATKRDRAESRVSSGRTSITYEESFVDSLGTRAKRLGASDDLVGFAAKPTASIDTVDTRGVF